MTKIILLLLLVSTSVQAKLDIMRAIYLAEPPSLGGPDEEDELSMTGEFGMLFAQGNTNTSTLTAKINAEQELQQWSYQVIGDVLYKTNKSEINGHTQRNTSAQRIFLSTQVDYKLTKPNQRLFVYSEYENKRFSAFSHQAAIAAGWSERLWRDDESELRYSIGPGYAIAQADQSSQQEDEDGLIIRAAMEYKRKFSKLATFRQFISAESDQQFTRTKTETSLSAKISGDLAMKLSFIMDLNSGETVGSETLNTETALTLVYQFF